MFSQGDLIMARVLITAEAHVSRNCDFSALRSAGSPVLVGRSGEAIRLRQCRLFGLISFIGEAAAFNGVRCQVRR